MKITILCVGKTKSAALQTLEQEYIKRLQPYVQVKIMMVEDAPIRKGDDPLKAGVIEGERLCKVLNNAPYPIGLDPTGTLFSSEKFAIFLQNIRDREGNCTFVIGGTTGLSPDIKKKMRAFISLSPMTFTHEMVRTIFLEQLYRAVMIQQKKAYHY